MQVQIQFNISTSQSKVYEYGMLGAESLSLNSLRLSVTFLGQCPRTKFKSAVSFVNLLFPFPPETWRSYRKLKRLPKRLSFQELLIGHGPKTSNCKFSSQIVISRDKPQT